MRVKVIVSCVDTMKLDGVFSSVNVNAEWYVEEFDFFATPEDFGRLRSCLSKQFHKMEEEAQLGCYDEPCILNLDRAAVEYLHYEGGDYEIELDVFNFVIRGKVGHKFKNEEQDFETTYLFVPRLVEIEGEIDNES